MGLSKIRIVFIPSGLQYQKRLILIVYIAIATINDKNVTHNMTKHIKTSLQSMVHHRKIPTFDLTKASAKFKVVTSNGLGGDAFTRKYIISRFKHKTLPSILYII